MFTLDFWLKQIFHVVDEVTLLVKNNNKKQNNVFSGTFYKVNLGGSYICVVFDRSPVYPKLHSVRSLSCYLNNRNLEVNDLVTHVAAK